MSMRSVLCGPLFLTLVLSVGCTGRSPAGRAGSAKRIDPCALVSREEAEKLMGVSFDPGKTKEQGAVGLALCIYEETGKRGGGALVQVGITQQSAIPSGSKMTPERVFRSIRSEGFPEASPHRWHSGGSLRRP